MGIYFLDSSAIAKRYVPEQGRSWILTLCDPAQGHELYLSQATLVEVVAAMCRRAREQSITITDRDRLINIFRHDCQNSYNILLITDSICTFAGDLCRSYNLRAYDAVQLACALRLHEEALATQSTVPIFVSADIKLINFAAAEGMGADDPNNHL